MSTGDLSLTLIFSKWVLKTLNRPKFWVLTLRDHTRLRYHNACNSWNRSLSVICFLVFWTKNSVDCIKLRFFAKKLTLSFPGGAEFFRNRQKISLYQVVLRLRLQVKLLNYNSFFVGTFDSLLTKLSCENDNIWGMNKLIVSIPFHS